jgi:hypothetical protein
MAISIKQISVKNLGPITNISFDLGKFNLIYGHNETGKTFLTEFLLSSLFKDASNWSLRNVHGQGRLTLMGLEPNAVSFSPESKKKLEDYWQHQERGLPLNFARLLVVRGGQPALSPNSAGGVGRQVLKRAVSDDMMIEQVLNRIGSKTIQQSKIIGHEIEGDKRGNLKRRIECRENWQQRKALLNRVHTEYSGGSVHRLETEKEDIESALAVQEKAKRHHAYCIHQHLIKVMNEREKFDENDIRILREKINREEELRASLEEVDEKIKKQEPIFEHLPWLEQAVNIWTQLSLGNAKEGGLVAPILGTFFMLLSLVISAWGTLFFERQGSQSGSLISIGISFVLFFAAIGILWYWYWRVKQWMKHIVNTDERREIEVGFKNRFGKDLHGLTDLRSKYDEVKSVKIQVATLIEQMRKDEDQQKACIQAIRNLFRALIGKSDIPYEDWKENLIKIEDKCAELDSKIKDCELTLSSLGVDEQNYIRANPNITYDRSKEKCLQETLSQLNDELVEARKNLAELESSVRTITHDLVGTPWGTLIFHLQEACDQAEEDYRSETAYILAGIGLTNILDKVRQEEDEKIDRALQSPEVKSALSMITNHYDGLSLVEETISVDGEFGQFNLDALSTGAREQVQIALRIGLAKRISHGEPLFMILDDAFQHSDWIRRGRLFDQVLGMVKSGWQILYLTMDDHIRDLANQLGNKILGDEFRSFILN